MTEVMAWATMRSPEKSATAIGRGLPPEPMISMDGCACASPALHRQAAAKKRISVFIGGLYRLPLLGLVQRPEPEFQAVLKIFLAVRRWQGAGFEDGAIDGVIEGLIARAFLQGGVED